MRYRVAITIILLLLLFYTGVTEAVVKLKIVVVNPSQTSKQTTPVKFDLPKGVGPEHIVDIADMELMYDFEKETYYVRKNITLEPSEKKILEVKLVDIWAIPSAEINFLKEHATSLEKKLSDTKHAEVGTDLSGKIVTRLDDITMKQEKSSLSIGENINTYYENVTILEEVKRDMGMLENLVLDVGGVVEERVEVPPTLAVSVGEDGKFNPEDVIELKIKISNPSKKRKQITPVKYNLPAEVMPRYILDASGLDVAYNFTEEHFYVYKDAVELEPEEVKIFVIKVMNIWKVPQVELEALKAHTNNLMLLLEGTPYLEQAQPIKDKIFFNLDEIIKYQSMDVDVVQHIAYYRDDTSRLDETRRYVAQLEKIITQSGSTPGVTIAKAEIIEGGGPEPKRQTGYEGIRLIAESIFRGKAPTPATTWKIIFTILTFVGFVGMLFFILWYTQVHKRPKP